MITLRRATERQHDQRRKQGTWFTLDPRAGNSTGTRGFGALELLKEGRLPPRTASPLHPSQDAEIITYVREGTLGFEDATGCAGLIQAGEFQRMTVGRGIRYSETNASPTGWAHVFQIWLRASDAGLEPGHEEERFHVAERRGRLCLVASPDARNGSLRIHQDALLYSAILDPGQHIVHELAKGRSAWVHLVEGEARLGDTVLTTGDGAGVSLERAVSLTAKVESEIMLLDLAQWLPNPELTGNL